MISFKDFLKSIFEQTILPRGKETDVVIARHPTAQQYKKGVLNPTGYYGGQIVHKGQQYQITHVPTENKTVYHHMPTGIPVAVVKYEKNRQGTITNIPYAGVHSGTPTGFARPAMAHMALTGQKVELNSSKLRTTPQGDKMVRIGQKKYGWTVKEEYLDKKTPSLSTLIKKNGKNILKQLKKGIKVEKEHTSNDKIAREIALDHLGELPDYYTRLSKMEK